jgi:hypothetical protein
MMVKRQKAAKEAAAMAKEEKAAAEAERAAAEEERREREDKRRKEEALDRELSKRPIRGVPLGECSQQKKR